MLEDQIRQWAQTTIGAPDAGRRLTGACLSFPDAETLAKGEAPPPPASVKDHLQSCSRCRQLVEDFRQALTEPAWQKPASAATWSRHLQLAVAASILLAVGAGIYLSLPSRHQPATDLVGQVRIGLRSQIEEGLFPRGQLVFASGEAVMLRVALNREACLLLINLTPDGKLVALPPLADSPGRVQLAAAGAWNLGPYRLDHTLGRETFFVVASAASAQKLEGRLQQLISSHAANTYDPASLATALRGWPAEVEVISFDHIAAQVKSADGQGE